MARLNQQLNAESAIGPDDSITEYPDEYIGKCIEAFERFDLPEEIHERWQEFSEILEQIEQLKDAISRGHNPK